MRTQIHHVAVLVEDIEATIRDLPPNVEIGPVDS